MFNSVALDVVIGLVFIYLLYSLLITIVGEWVATKLGIRARLLRVAIERMLNDGYYAHLERKKQHWAKSFIIDRILLIPGWARKVLLFEPEEFKYSVAGKFYEYPAIKYLSRIEETHKSRFSLTKPAYISGEYFADSLFDFLKDKGSGATEMQRVAFCLKFNAHHIQPKSLKQLRNIFERAGNDKNAFKQNLIKWFNETMDRATGWHKRKMQLISFCLGLVIAIAFNVDTVTIAGKLAQDKAARDQLVQMSIQASDSTTALGKAIKNSLDTNIQKNINLAKRFEDLKHNTEEARRVLGLGWDSVKPERVHIPLTAYSFNYYPPFNPLRKEFWGLIITGIALSLGAPFWFDLMKKLVAIRGAGVKPEEKKENIKVAPIKEILAENSTSETHYLTNDPVEIALSLHQETLETIPGVLAVNYDYEDENSKKNACIEVSVTDYCNTALIPKSYEIKIKGDLYIVPIHIKTRNPASFHFSFSPNKPALAVQNKFNVNSDNGWGTVTGIVVNSSTKKKSILCCSHVFTSNNFNGERTIINFNGKEVGTLIFNIQSNLLDSAYADTDEETAKNYTWIRNFSDVVKTDAEMETEVIMDGSVSGVQEGKIINSRMSFPFLVNGEPMTMVNLIKIVRRDGTKKSAISTFGDSGALVTRKADNMPVALIIGGTHEFSLAIRLKEVFETLFIEPVKKTS